MAAPAPAPPSRSDPITLDDQEINGKDFGFVPIPRRLRHDPRKPHPWNLTLNIVFGLASTFTVANLYYCQPILIQLSQSFSVSYNDVSRIPTLVQAGYAVGLLFISPLGDLLPRRPLILILTFLAPSLTVILPLTSSLPTFSAVSFLIGILSITPQVLMPLAADLAPPSRRASALSIALSGLLLGILIARVLAGVVAQFVSWRIVYWVAFAVQWAVLGLEWACIPDYPSKNKKGEGLTYARIPWTMMRFLWTEPVVVQAVLICIASMSTFTNFWVTLTFLLGGPPYFYSTLAIGLFGLIGIAGVAFAPLIGRLVDHLSNWTATMISTVVLVGVWVVETAAAGLNKSSIGAVVITAFGLDVFRQMQQVSLTNWVFGLEGLEGARARLNALLIIALFIGQVIGTSSSTALFTSPSPSSSIPGWRASAALALGMQLFCVLVLVVRGPRCGRWEWVGWGSRGAGGGGGVRGGEEEGRGGGEKEGVKGGEGGGREKEEEKEGGENLRRDEENLRRDEEKEIGREKEIGNEREIGKEKLRRDEENLRRDEEKENGNSHNDKVESPKAPKGPSPSPSPSPSGEGPQKEPA